MAEFFDVLNSIVNKKEIQEDDIDKHFNGFIAIKWLSGNPMACYTANILNSTRGNDKIPKHAEYKFLKESIKLPKNTRLSFDKIDKDINVIINVIMNEFKVGKNTAKEYINILPSEMLLKIIEKHAQITNNYTTDPAILEIRKALTNKRQELTKGI